MPGALTFTALLLGLACCGRSAEDVQAEFDSHVAGANQCTAAAECVAVFPGCPLGCATAVRKDRRADVERKARDLVAAYERGVGMCEYECTEQGPLACVSGRCGFAPVEVARQPTSVTLQVRNAGTKPAFMSAMDCQNYVLAFESEGQSRPIVAQRFCPTCACSQAPCLSLPTCGACLPALGSVIAPGETASVTWSGIDHGRDEARACTREDVAPLGHYRFAVEFFSSEDDAFARRNPRTASVEFDLPDSDGAVTLTLPVP